MKCQTKRSLMKPLRLGCCHVENYNFNQIYINGSECSMKLQNKSQGKSQEITRNHKKLLEISKKSQEITKKSQEITRKSERNPKKSHGNH